MTYGLTIKKALRVSALINLLYNSQQTLLPAGHKKHGFIKSNQKVTQTTFNS